MDLPSWVAPLVAVILFIAAVAVINFWGPKDSESRRER